MQKNKYRTGYRNKMSNLVELGGLHCILGYLLDRRPLRFLRVGDVCHLSVHSGTSPHANATTTTTTQRAPAVNFSNCIGQCGRRARADKLEQHYRDALSSPSVHLSL